MIVNASAPPKTTASPKSIHVNSKSRINCDGLLSLPGCNSGDTDLQEPIHVPVCRLLRWEGPPIIPWIFHYGWSLSMWILHDLYHGGIMFFIVFFCFSVLFCFVVFLRPHHSQIGSPCRLISNNMGGFLNTGTCHCISILIYVAASKPSFFDNHH